MLNEKNWEGKSAKCKAKYMAYACVKKDSKVEGWYSKPQIKPGHVHVIARITSITSPGCEGYRYDWNIDTITKLEPVILPKGVGRGTGFYPCNNKHLEKPFQDIMKQLAR